MKPSDWIGRVGDTWAAEWQRTDRSFAALDPVLVDAVVAAAGAEPVRALDIGCGAGATGLAFAAARPDATVLGVDLSDALVSVATARGVRSRLPCRFEVGDAVAVARREGPFDLFFSRHGVMFFEDPDAAFGALAEAAAPGAALVFSCFAALTDNPWATEPVTAVSAATTTEPGPFAFAEPERVAGILRRAGWVASPPQAIAFDYVAGVGPDPVADACSFFRRIGPAARTLAGAAAPERAALEARIAAACERRRDGDRVAFPARAWLWSARKGVRP